MSQRWLTKAQAAKELLVSLKQIERYVEEGIPCKDDGPKRRFPFPQIRVWQREYDRQAGERRAAAKEARRPTVSLEQARLRKESAEAILKEMAVAEAEARLVPIEVYESRLRARCEELAAICRTLNQYVGDVQLASTEQAANVLLDRIGDRLLRALADVSAVAVDDVEDDDGPDGGEAAAA